MQRFHEADRLLVIAGGSGAGWSLSLLELFCRQRAAAHSIGSPSEAFEKDAERGTRAMVIDNPGYYRSIRIVFATRDAGSRTWFLATVHKLLEEYSCPYPSPDLTIDVHLTGEGTASVNDGAADGSKTPSPTADGISIDTEDSNANVPSTETSGRPDLSRVIHQEGKATAAENRSLSVYVCGPISMQNNVRNAAAKENLAILTCSKPRGVYLHSEHFSWA